jgi:hypothetical protein
MVVVRKKRRVEVDDEPEQAEPSNGKIVVLRTIRRGDVPKGRYPGPRNPEYDRLVRRLIRLETMDKAVVIPVASKTEKVKLREAVRKPLKVRGYDLTAVTDYDDEVGEVLMLFATKRMEEEPPEDEEEPEVEEDEEVEADDDEEEEETAPVVVRRKKVRRG